MLKEASSWLQTNHDHAQELNLHENISKDYTSSFVEALSFHIFQLEVESNPDNVKDQFLGGDEYHDELWLFGKESQISMCMHSISLKFSIEGVIIKQWFGAVPLRYAWLIQKGSYFSQPVNGFT